MSKVTKSPITYTVTVSQTFSKTVHVTTDDYKLLKVYNSETKECYLCDNTIDTDWKKAFEREHWDIASLLGVLKDYIKDDMLNHTTDRGQRQLESLFMACNNWHEDEYEVIKE